MVNALDANRLTLIVISSKLLEVTLYQVCNPSVMKHATPAAREQGKEQFGGGFELTSQPGRNVRLHRVGTLRTGQAHHKLATARLLAHLTLSFHTPEAT